MKKLILLFITLACIGCKKTEVGANYPLTSLENTTWYAYSYTLVGFKYYNYIKFNSTTSATVYDAMVDNVKQLNPATYPCTITKNPNNIDAFEIYSKGVIDLTGFTTDNPNKIMVAGIAYAKY